MLTQVEAMLSNRDFYFICDECRGAFVLRKGYILEELDDEQFDSEIESLGFDPANAPYGFCDDCHLKVN